MSTRTRFILIALGIVIFLVLSPLAIFFARGFRFNISEGEITKTGALVVRSNPKGADVYLNEKRLKTTPLTKRFVFPGDYRIVIEKPGYQPWQKQISVNPQLVANPAQKGKEDVFLFFADPIQNLLATDTVDFLFEGNEITSLNSNLEIITTKPSGDSKILFAKAQAEPRNPKLLEKNSGFVLISDTARFLLVSPEQTFELPAPLSRPTLLNNQGIILGLDENNALIEYNPTENSGRILDEKVSAFKKEGEDVYYLKDADLIRLNPDGQKSIVAENIPLSDGPEIITTPDRQIFLLIDKTLYRVNENLEVVNRNVSYAIWPRGADALIYGNETEAWLFWPMNENRNELLARDSTGVSIPQYNARTGYYFIKSAGKIQAFEASFDGQPNVFDLAREIEKGDKFIVDRDAEYIYLQKSGSLISLKIR